MDYVNRTESRKVLLNIAGDVNNEQCLINWGLDNGKQEKID